MNVTPLSLSQNIILYSPFLILGWCGMIKPTRGDEVRWMILGYYWPSDLLSEGESCFLTTVDHRKSKPWIRGNYCNLCYIVMKEVCVKTKQNFHYRDDLAKSRFFFFNLMFLSRSNIIPSLNIYFSSNEKPHFLGLKSTYCLTALYALTPYKYV